MMEAWREHPDSYGRCPLEGDELATLAVDDHGELAVSTSVGRVEPEPGGPGGFDAIESLGRGTPHGMEHTNFYAHRSSGIDARGRVTWEHSKLRIVRANSEGWVALTDRHDVVLIDPAGAATQRQRLRGDTWRICGWRAGNPVVSSDPDATWVDPYVYSARVGGSRMPTRPCVRLLDGLIGFDDGFELMWSLSTNSISHVTARDGLLYVVAGKSGALVLAAYANP